MPIRRSCGGESAETARRTGEERLTRLGDRSYPCAWGEPFVEDRDRMDFAGRWGVRAALLALVIQGTVAAWHHHPGGCRSGCASHQSVANSATIDHDDHWHFGCESTGGGCESNEPPASLPDSGKSGSDDRSCDLCRLLAGIVGPRIPEPLAVARCVAAPERLTTGSVAPCSRLETLPLSLRGPPATI